MDSLKTEPNSLIVDDILRTTMLAAHSRSLKCSPQNVSRINRITTVRAGLNFLESDKEGKRRQLKMMKVQSSVVRNTRAYFQTKCVPEPRSCRPQSLPITIPSLPVSSPPESKLRKYLEKIAIH